MMCLINNICSRQSLSRRRHPPPSRSKKKTTNHQQELRGRAELCDIYAKIAAGRSASAGARGGSTSPGTADTHFETVTVNPGSRCGTADAGRIREKLRLSPYCCCCLPPQREQLPCIIDDSQQSGECRPVRSVPILKVIEACSFQPPLSLREGMLGKHAQIHVHTHNVSLRVSCAGISLPGHQCVQVRKSMFPENVLSHQVWKQTLLSSGQNPQ